MKNTHRLHLEDVLIRSSQQKKRKFNIRGTQSTTAVSFLIAQGFSYHINGLANLIVVSSLEEALKLEKQLSFFSPKIKSHILKNFDVTPYSGLYPSPTISWSRTQFLYWANSFADDTESLHVFIVPILGLMQKTAPYFNFHKRSQKIKIGSELSSSLSNYLHDLGYQPAPIVEDKGQYSIRGGIVDIFSTAENKPVRIELFGDQVESMRYFSATSQLSEEEVSIFNLSPVFEYELTDDNIIDVVKKFKEQLGERKVSYADRDETLRSLTQKNLFTGAEFLLPLCYEKLNSVIDHFSTDLNIYIVDPVEVSRVADEYWSELKLDYKNNESSLFHPEIEQLFFSYDKIEYPKDSFIYQFSNLSFIDNEIVNEVVVEYKSSSLPEFTQISQNFIPGSQEWINQIQPKISTWLNDKYKIFISTKNQTQVDRIKSLLDRLEFAYEFTPSSTDSSLMVANYNFEKWLSFLDQPRQPIHIISRDLNETLMLHDEQVIFLKADDFFGRKQRTTSQNSYEEFSQNAKRLSFGDLKPNDLVVHIKHGVGVYEGLKIMNVGGVDAEFIQIAYKDKDKLYLPVYRVGQLQKFSGAATTVLDKLGGTGWEKTKSKVKNHLRDIASELLQLYARRAEVSRLPIELNEISYAQFERAFPYDETNDQLRAINEIQKDFHSNKPMDRLVCGDVGFGKTEVAMRAAFQAAAAKKQVAVLAPTTVLTFQHLETFKKRFSSFNFEIRSLNRFVSPADQKKTLTDLKDGKVDILVGTHRLLSKDVGFKDLGLLIIDEEQKFGVIHKEKIKKLKNNVDTLTLSATPIPRTLNMSFTGLRDLSIINTAPVDRLPTRTFVSKFDSELIRKGITSEIARGGQVYFIHNRVQSIYAIADELRKIVPDARMKVAHGQMEEHELEEAMLAFFSHEIDVLICTAIVESGMDVPRANTMFIDQAHMFGLSQLYQLRGRVGRSKARAYCYLLIPKDKRLEKDAQERLKIIQDNSALGSGIKIAQYDLELRGAGNILGDDQSGHINSVGYEMYMDLLNEAISEAKGEDLGDQELDPEINLRIPALIPENYIKDIRLRLSYYKALAEIESQDDLDLIERELRDQFGELPEPVVNLMGLMLIRRQCKNLGVRDISAGLKNISLIFTEQTKLKPETAIQLAMRENKKYSMTPDQRLNVRMNNISWSNVYEELQYLISLT